MSAAHTPGPWDYAQGFSAGRKVVSLVGVAKARRVIAQCGGPDRDANARLIAAAPDLLRVAELLVHWLDEEPSAHKLCDAARAAIARATGVS